MQPSLYERLGGIYSIATVVDDFIERVMNDPRLNANYRGRPMRESHEHLNITPKEWDAFMDDLQQTLDKFSVPADEQAELKAIVNSTYGTS